MTDIPDGEKSIESILESNNPGTVTDNKHPDYYLEMFAPCVNVSILKPSDLARYSNQTIYIRRSEHVPPSMEGVRDLILAFFEILYDEDNAGVRVVLGHFFFVFIHSYSDGNGRFLMNSMMVSGGYQWTLIQLEKS